jgi:hypothetical protein
MTDAERNAARWAQAEAMNAAYNEPPEPSEAEVRANLLPPQDDTHCAHGLVIGDNSAIEGVGFARLETCLCCEQTFPLVGSAGYRRPRRSRGYGGGVGDYSESSMPDRFLCEHCGGRTRLEVHGIPQETKVRSNAPCVGGWDDKHSAEPGELLSMDPRISYRDVTRCVKCGTILAWTRVWFADLQ